MFIMERQGFSMLINKFTGDEATLFTYRYTKAFEELAEEIADKREYIQATTDKVVTNKVLSFDDLNKIRFSTGSSS
jgi:phage regulator Rha-like protein